MKNTIQILRQFAVTDGLISGTALFSNIVATTSFALIPGFGKNSILLSGFVQLTISGLLEVPTGWLADRFGWVRAVLWALRLKYLVTLAFLFAVISSESALTSYSWYFVALEALIDSVAGALLNGAYEVAYLKWYEVELPRDRNSQAPPLFLASYKYAWKVRFAIPLMSAVLLFIVHQYFGKASFSPHTLTYISIFTVFALRTLVYKKVLGDLKPMLLKDSINHRNFEEKGFFSQFFCSMQALKAEASKTRRELAVYASASFLTSIGTFYFFGEGIRVLGGLVSTKQDAWLAGVFLGLAIYLVMSLYGLFVLPRIASNANREFKPMTLAFLLASAANTLLFKEVSSGSAQLVLLVTYGLAACLLGSTIIRRLNSNLSEFVSEHIRASWVSLGCALGLLAFGLCAGSLIAFELRSHASSIIAFICVPVSLYLLFNLQPVSSDKNGKTITLWEALERNSFGLFSICFASFIFADLVSFAISKVQAEQRHELMVANLAVQSIREPLSQGSFPEAMYRLQSLQASNTIVCAKLQAWSSKVDLCQNVETSRLSATLVQPIVLGSEDSSQIGELNIVFERLSLWREIAFRIACALVLAALGLVTVFHLLRKIGGNIEEELHSVLTAAKGTGGTNNPRLRILEFRELANDLQKVWKEREQSLQNAAIGSLAQQVAHDIRSPLAALEMISSRLEDLEEDRRLLLRHAIGRIRDIANNLLKRRGGKNSRTFSSQETSVELLPALVNEMISEKREQYKCRSDIEIEVCSSNEVYGLFAKVQPTEFGRVVSNLVDNAVEALETSGHIHIRFACVDQLSFRLEVEDNGKGIPAEIVPRLMSRGESHGKASGSGLGLAHAKSCAEEWRGSIEIDSQIGRGTKVLISLPRAPSPLWFAEQLTVFSGGSVVVVDDDPSIHQVWNQRFYQANVNIVHCYSSKSLLSWMLLHPTEAKESLYLVDFDLSEDWTGLALILAHKLQHIAILVTSRSDETEIRDLCEKSGVRVVPKNMAALVPIVLRKASYSTRLAEFSL